MFSCLENQVFWCQRRVSGSFSIDSELKGEDIAEYLAVTLLLTGINLCKDESVKNKL